MLLVWPAGTSREQFRIQFGLFCLVQGGIQILLNRYQLARLYSAKAMGVANKMDVPGEIEGVAALLAGEKLSIEPDTLTRKKRKLCL